MIDQIILGGPAPTMPEVPPIDPNQDLTQDPTQVAPEQTGDQPVSDEQKQVLLDMINEIRVKLGNVHAANFATKNKIEKLRSDLLKQVFEKLQLAGVDLTSNESVSNFLNNLQQVSPQIAANFEKAMDLLLGGDGMQGAPQDPTQSMDLSVPPENNMNNENQNGAPIQNIQSNQ